MNEMYIESILPALSLAYLERLAIEYLTCRPSFHSRNTLIYREGASMPGIFLTINKLVRPNKGQSIVEFALVLPVLLLLLGGIIDFGYVFYQYITINHVATNVARSSAIQIKAGETDDTITTYAQADQPKAWDIKATIVYPSGVRTPSQELAATVSCKPQPLTGLLQTLFPDRITATVRTRVEQ